jgi:hypothetical protein
MREGRGLHLYRWEISLLTIDVRKKKLKTALLLLLFNTTRALSGPPSTGAAIAMDGGVADTACYYTGR